MKTTKDKKSISPDDIIDVMLSSEFLKKLVKRVAVEVGDRYAEMRKESGGDGKVTGCNIPVMNENGYGLTTYCDKVLNAKKTVIGRNVFFRYLRTNGYLGSPGSSIYNLPRKKAVDDGLMVIDVTEFTTPSGTQETRKARLTKKGAEYFYRKIVIDKTR